MTYNKPLMTVAIVTPTAVGVASDTETMPYATNALSDFHRKDTVKSTEDGSVVMLIPYHAIRCVTYYITPAEMTKGDAYGCEPSTADPLPGDVVNPPVIGS